MQRMVNILDTVQQLLYLTNSRNFQLLGAGYPRERRRGGSFIQAGHEDALLRLPSVDKTTRENYSCYLLECYED